MIITKNDNIAWIRRNLKILLNNDKLAEQIGIYALQNDKYLNFGGSKILAIQDVQKNNSSITVAILIDDDINEGENLKQLASINDQTMFKDILFIHAAEGNQDYLQKIADQADFNLVDVTQISPSKESTERTSLIQH